MRAIDLRGSDLLSRRAFLGGAAVATITGLIGCTGGSGKGSSSSQGAAEPIACEAPPGGARAPLWATAIERGIVFGSSATTWQLDDPEYRELFTREAAIVLTEDDLLWWRLKPAPDAPLDFRFADRLVDFAEREGLAVLGAHLVWDEGFGDGWSDDDLWSIGATQARKLLYGTIEEEVTRYRGRIAAWIVANEVLDGDGLRLDSPWSSTIGPSFVPDAFRVAHEADPDARLLLNDFGYETDDDLALAEDKRAATLTQLDELLADDVPVHALGVQAHLAAASFADAFDAESYRAFLAEVAGRGLDIVITEMDVLDDGLPPDIAERDAAVADTIARYLDTALDEPSVGSVITFGLTDRYSWLEEEFPRADGAPRRPLPFDDAMAPKPAVPALATSLAEAPAREPFVMPPRC